MSCAPQVRQALQGRTLFGLINNAGIANHACLAHQPIEEFRTVIQINLIGALAVTQVRLEEVSLTLVSPACVIRGMNSCDTGLCCCVPASISHCMQRLFRYSQQWPTVQCIPAVMQCAAGAAQAPINPTKCSACAHCHIIIFYNAIFSAGIPATARGGYNFGGAPWAHHQHVIHIREVQRSICGGLLRIQARPGGHV